MSDSVLAIEQSSRGKTKAMILALWGARLLVAGILGLAAFTKLFVFTPDGSMALAEAMGVGRGVITLIGLVELIAATLVLLPRTHALGAALAALTMSGALLTHATTIGWTGNAAAEMWPLALAVLAGAVFALLGRRAGRASTASRAG
jgi:uncharacterized membrane protein YphA (DoxX/SURF4 family)